MPCNQGINQSRHAAQCNPHVVCFHCVGKPEDELGYVNVAMVDATKRVVELMSSPSLPHYLAFHVANEVCASLYA